MDHGVTAAHSREISNRAREVSNRSSRSISAVRQVLDEYDQEMEAHKDRIAIMEIAEVHRLQQELAYQEELANNHGKPKDWWKVPAFQT